MVYVTDSSPQSQENSPAKKHSFGRATEHRFKLARELGADVAFDDAGRAVWACRDLDEFNELSEFARSMRVEMEIVEANFSNVRSTEYLRDGVVVGFALDDRSIADTYAALTSRRVVYALKVDDIDPTHQIAVVIFTSRNLTEDLLEYLYVRYSLLKAPGLIFASDEFLLRKMVKRFAMGMVFYSPTGIAQARVSLTNELASKDINRFISAGSESSREQLKYALSVGADALILEGHSDGLHMFMPGGAMLCPAATRKRVSLSDNTPLCIQNGRCYRYPHNPPIKQANESGMLIDPAIVRARVVIQVTCLGLQVADGVLDPANNLATALIERSQFLNLITTWQTTLSDHALPDRLLAHLASGQTMGEVVANYNLQDTQARNGFRFALLGDPDVLLSSSRTYSPGFSCGGSSTAMVEFFRSSVTAAFIERCITFGRSQYPYCDNVAGEKTLNALDAAIQAVEAGFESDSIFRHNLLKYIGSFPRIEAASGESVAHVKSDTERCNHCNALGVDYELEYIGGRRHSFVCPRCGDTNLANSIPLALLSTNKLTHGYLRLTGVTQGTSAAIVIVSRRRMDTLFIHWPQMDGDCPAAEFKLPIQLLPEGELLVRVLTVRKLDIDIQTIKMRLTGTELKTSANAKNLA